MNWDAVMAQYLDSQLLARTPGVLPPAPGQPDGTLMPAPVSSWGAIRMPPSADVDAMQTEADANAKRAQAAQRSAALNPLLGIGQTLNALSEDLHSGRIWREAIAATVAVGMILLGAWALVKG